MVTALIPKENENCHVALKRVITEYVTVSDEIKAFPADYYRQVYKNSERYYPERIKPIVKLYSTGISKNPSSQAYAHVFSANFAADCVKNPCRAKARLRIFAYSATKLCSKIRTHFL